MFINPAPDDIPVNQSVAGRRNVSGEFHQISFLNKLHHNSFLISG